MTMKKGQIKKIIVAMITIIFTMTYVFPPNIVTAQQQGNELGPDNFQEKLETAASSILVIDSYAHSVIDSQLPQLNGISSVDNHLKVNIRTNFTDAQENATYWLDQLKPNIRLSIKTVVDFNKTWQDHYNHLLNAIEQKNEQHVQKEIEELYQTILRNSEKVDDMIKDLTTYRDSISEDVKHFKENSNQLQVVLSQSDASIPMLKEQIEHYHRIIENAKWKIGGGAILCGLIIFCIAGGPIIAEAFKEKDNAESQIASLQAQISGIEKEVVIITDIENKLTTLADTIDKAIDSLQNISNQWHVIAVKYCHLVNNVAVFDAQDFELLEEDVNIAKTSWEQLEQFATKVFEALKKENMIETIG
ncbi:MAG: HBL/NHE enterotoxin family protein [Virgibacillus proomii]|jgi:non-hemolytic enterotoxin B/C